MGLAIDTVLGFATNPGAAGAAVTPATGDSLTVKSFAGTSKATLEQVIREGTTPGFVEVKSPMFHDNVRGIHIFTSESPSRYLLPPVVGQALVQQDTLAVSVSGGTAETDIIALSNYYQDLDGASATLRAWGDIASNIKSIKPLEVDVTSTAAIGQWSDTLITGTENLLHANTPYAVLGYTSDVALGVIGVKGQFTSNLRVCGMGAVDTDTTSQIFVNLSNYHQTPHIPVFNSADKDSVYVSVAASTASVVAKVTLLLAELSGSV